MSRNKTELRANIINVFTVGVTADVTAGVTVGVTIPIIVKCIDIFSMDSNSWFIHNIEPTMEVE